ncbi:MAG: endonuclease/exonuclease/phosphatase family protein [Bacteroidales bacterium]
MSVKKHNGSRKKAPLLFGLTFRLILIVAGIAMILSYISVFINPSQISLPLFFGLYFIPILITNLVLLILALIRRSKSAWIPIMVLLPALMFTDLFYKIGGDNSSDIEGIKLKIESYNVGMFSSSKLKYTKEECRIKVINHITESNPDIACFQEFHVNTKAQMDSILPQYKYRYYHVFKIQNGKYFGNLILSRFPIVSKGKLSFRRSTNLSIYVDIEHFGRIIRIYNNHLESYNISFTALVQKLNKREKVLGDEIKNDIKEVHEKVLGTFIKRSDQVNKIMENITQSSHPAIICGDFNDTPMSFTYHRLSKNRKDSFRESGSGFGASFIPLWPLLRIDYILFPKEFGCINHKTHKIKLSDHYPISSDIII